VVGFGDLINVRPFQLGLCRNRTTINQDDEDDGAYRPEIARPNGHKPSETRLPETSWISSANVAEMIGGRKQTRVAVSPI
jgi:hypothetical protein